MLTPRKLYSCFTDAFVNTLKHDGVEHAGYLAFLLLLALFPFLVLLVALAGFMGEGQAGSDFIKQLFANLPPNMVQALTPRVEEIISGPPTGLLSIAILGAIWTSSGAVEGYRTILNRAYHVGTPPSYILRRALSILQLLIFLFIVLVGMLFIVSAPVVLAKIEGLVGFPFLTQNALAWSFWIFCITIAVLFGMVSNMYYALPNIQQHWRAVVPGAGLTVLLWLLAAKALTLYFLHFNQVNMIYGSLGGIIATMLFFYIINMIFIYGAEFNYLLAKEHGERMQQKEAAPPPVSQSKIKE